MRKRRGTVMMTMAILLSIFVGGASVMLFSTILSTGRQIEQCEGLLQARAAAEGAIELWMFRKSRSAPDAKEITYESFRALGTAVAAEQNGLWLVRATGKSLGEIPAEVRLEVLLEKKAEAGWTVRSWAER